MIGQDVGKVEYEQFHFSNALSERLDEGFLLAEGDGISRQVERVQVSAAEAGGSGVQIGGEGEQMILGEQIVAQVEELQGGQRCWGRGRRGWKGRGRG